MPKWAFFASATLWLVGGASIQIAINRGGNIITLLNLHSIFVTGFGSLAVVLGMILLGRWIWLKSDQLSANRKEQLSWRKSITTRNERDQEPQNNKGQEKNVMDRWNALVRYDEEIRAAAEKLRPFGDSWVNELAQAYLALNEDRKYLPSIVSRLVEEAEQDKAQRWTKPFRQTADGNLCTEESLNILREAKARGYALCVEKNNIFTATKNGGTSYLRTNADIQGFGQFAQILPRSRRRVMRRP